MVDQVQGAGCWDGSVLRVSCAEHNGGIAVCDASELSHEVFHPNMPRMVYWPLERLLVRRVALPLKHPRLLDVEILRQYLSEQTMFSPEDWWLAWSVSSHAEGVAGIVYGLSAEDREHVEGNFAQAHIRIDGVDRCLSWVDADTRAAVLDQDEQGLFFAFMDHGLCLGIRRVNMAWDNNDADSMSMLTHDVFASLQAMGWTAEDLVVGRLSEAFSAVFLEYMPAWEGVIIQDIPSRDAATLSLPIMAEQGIDFRHGTWAVATLWQQELRWKRPVALLVSVLCLWMVTTLSSMYALNGQANQYRAQVLQAFHQGLPQESVVIDPLAQLQKAVERSGSANVNVLHSVAIVSQVHQRQPWTMESLAFDAKSARLSGDAHDMKQLQMIREQLQRALGLDVQIVDTQLASDSVAFRLRWEL